MRGKFFGFSVMLWCAATASLVSCSEEKGTEDKECRIEISEPSVEFAASDSEQALSKELTLTASDYWYVDETPDWIALSPMDGEAGECSLTLGVGMYGGSQDRSAELTFRCGSASAAVRVLQRGVGAVKLSESSFNVSQAGDVLEIVVEATSDWTASGDSDYVVLSAESGKAGRSDVSVTVLANDTPQSRTATVRFSSVAGGSATLTVVQSQSDVLSAVERSYDVGIGGGNIEVQVDANVDVACSILDDWISDASVRAVQSRDYVFTVSANDTPEVRTGRIAFYNVSSSLSDTVYVVQQSDPTAVPDVEGMTIKGRITCDGAAVEGVVVSDGRITAQTDSRGIYYLASDKPMGYVFMSIPSGYRASADIFAPALPKIHSMLEADALTVERHDFILEKARDSKRHVMMLMTDTHLYNGRRATGSQTDLYRFSLKFIPDLKKEIAAYDSETDVYCLHLGDITYDLYYYNDMTTMTSPRVQFPEYVSYVKKIPAQIFHVAGNHDSDPKLKGDLACQRQFTEYLAPAYYSFNIGDVHYIVLDNCQYEDFNGGDRISPITVIGDSDPQKWQLEWLAQDLKYVDKQKQHVVVAMHAPISKLTSSFQQTLNAGMAGGSRLLSMLSGYDVRFVSGHTHVNYQTEGSGYVEHNVAAASAVWWHNDCLAGNTGTDYDMSRDGSPSGYLVMDFDGRDVSYYYKGVGLDRSRLAAVYDMADIKSEYYSELKASADEVLVNVWYWGKGWTINVTADGAPVSVQRVYRKDPVYYTWWKEVFCAKQENPDGASALNNTHLFSVSGLRSGAEIKVEVCDPFGGRYTQTVVKK